ncbi:hypothetical protein [Microscilla marina]|uniref:Lipoprotein, putative n=1 Tax=Microscilla marina ATCC 23134 TaxID=313606 RepID=A1ZJA8_MICM2|nr:hypothetical protein [Microscilla marina]EAY29644.1 lipoprotein, putative [Microscilla marina ATCC 23134]
MTNVKYYILWLFFLVGACTSSPENNTNQDNLHQHHKLHPKAAIDTAQQRQMVDSLYQRLQRAYETKSTIRLNTFVQDWAAYSAKQAQSYPTSDTIAQALIQVFMAMLSSNDFTSVDWKSYQHKVLFTDAKYLLMQGSVPYSIGFAKNAHRDTLRNFSLPIKYPNLTMLYCDEVYTQAFSRFLAKDIDYSKKSFLGKILTLPPWAINSIGSQASIERIQLNHELTGAVVDYYLGNLIIKSWLMKQGNDWVIVRSIQNLAEYD